MTAEGEAPDKVTDQIRNRESWFKIAAGVIKLAAGTTLVGLLAWKIIVTPIGFEPFRANDILALVLALFSIGLSVAFYFKATDVSNKFYDNMYSFTKGTSEILGRIEAGFGERLRHLDEGYAGLMGSFAKRDPAATMQAVAVEQEAVKKLEGERNDLLEQLAHEGSLRDAEKQVLLQQINGKDSELRRARNEVGSLRRQLAGATTESEDSRELPRLSTVAAIATRKRVESFLLTAAERGLFDAVDFTSPTDANERFLELRDGFPPAFLTDLRTLGYIDDKDQLTRRATDRIARIVAAVHNRRRT